HRQSSIRSAGAMGCRARRDGGKPLRDLPRPHHRAAGAADPGRQGASGTGWSLYRQSREGGAMITTLQRYFGMRFLTTLTAVLLGVFALIVLLDYVESMRRMADVPNVSALLVAKISLYRVPQIG